MPPFARSPRAVHRAAAFLFLTLVPVLGAESTAHAATPLAREAFGASAFSVDSLPTAAMQEVKRVVIANCDLNPKLTEKTQVGAADPHGMVWGHVGRVRVIPVRREIAGTCAHHEIGRTDFFKVHAVFTIGLYQDGFGNWKHTPASLTCTGGRTAYQMDGGPIVPTGAAEATSGGCSLGELPAE